jgi:YVTN family beta-propeller protein
MIMSLLVGLVFVVVPGADASIAVPPANIYVLTSAGLKPMPIQGGTPGPVIPVGVTPHHVALSATGDTAYVSSFGDDKVYALDLVAGTVGGATAVGAKPEGIAVSPDGSKVYVANSKDNSVTQLAVAGTTLVAQKTIFAGLNPVGIAITPNGDTAYVTNGGSGTVTPIALASGTAGGPIPVGLNPQGIAVAPNGLTVYVVNAGSSTVTPITTGNNLPQPPIALATSAPGSAQPTAPSQIAITSDGLRGYVVDPAAAKVYVLDLTVNGKIKDIQLDVSLAPSDIAATPDGKTVYVTSSGGNAIVPITPNLADNTYAVGSSITGFSGALGIAITPDQAPVATLATSASVIPAGGTVTLDASGSTVAYGTITGYQFIFGDGTDPVVSTSPTVQHSYRYPGMFVAKVYELNSNGTSYFSVYTGQTMSRYSPTRNGLPQDAAALSITVTGDPVPARTHMMFVANFGGASVTPVALPEAGPPSASSPIPMPAGPAFSSVTPDGSAVVVTNFLANTVTPMSVCSSGTGTSIVPGSAVPSAVVPGQVAAPSQVAIAPFPLSKTDTTSEWVVFVVNSGTNNLSRFVLAVDKVACTATLTAPSSLASSVIPVGSSPYGIAISQDGQTAYVTNSGSGTVTPVNLATGTPGSPIPVGLKPRGIAITPDGKTVYVVNGDSATVTPISTASKMPGVPIRVGLNPLLIAITPDGKSAYVTSAGLPPAVTPIDIATNNARKPIGLPAGASPTGIVISPDGNIAYVADYSNGAVHRIEVATDLFSLPPIVGFNGPVGLAITPDQAPVAKILASATNVPAGTTVTLDASTSTVAFGTIEKYQFDFGDGTPPVVSGSPIVTHTYAAPGTYAAIVYELSSGGTGYLSSFTGQTFSRYAPKQPNGVPQDAAGVYITVSAAGAAIPPGTPVLYVSNLGNDTVTPIALPDAAPPIIGSTIDAGDGPASSATTPDKLALVVSDFYGNTVTPVGACNAGGTTKYTAGTPLATGAAPSQVAVSPIAAPGSTAAQPKWDVYVANSGANDVRHYVLTVNVAACTASLAVSLPISASIIPVGASPYGIAITPDGSTAYVSNTGSGTVTPIDLTLSPPKPGVPIPTGPRPQGVAVSPDGVTVYVANSGSNTVTPITVKTNTPGAPIVVGSSPVIVAVTPDSNAVFVTNTASASVSQINAASKQVVRTIAIPGGQPAAVAITPDGTTAWVSIYSSGALIPISVATGLIGSNVVSGLQQPVGVTASMTP